LIEFYLPEFTLLITLFALIFSEVTNYGERRLAGYLALLGLLTTLIQILTGFTGEDSIYGINLIFDQYSVFFKLFFVLLSALVITMSQFSQEISERRRGEFNMFIVAGTIGLCLISSAGDLLFLFMGFQMLNIVCFFLAGHRSESILSSEAAVKFLIFSVISSGFFLYSMAILYSHTHTLAFDEISLALVANPLSYHSNLIVFTFLLFSLAFYLAAFPFFLWIGDVLEGAPTPSAFFLCLAIPGAGVAAGFRLVNTVLGFNAEAVLNGVPWMWIVAVCAGATMLIGSLLALQQTNIKRLLAGLVVFHSGFVLAGMAVTPSVEGHAVVLFNQVVALFSLAGLYGTITVFHNHLRSDGLNHYRAALSYSFYEGFLLLLFLASFIGLPPFPGFFGKFALVNAVVQSGWYGLAALEIVSIVIAVGAFVRVAQILIPSDGHTAKTILLGQRIPHRIYLTGLMVPILVLTWMSESMLEWGRAALFH